VRQSTTKEWGQAPQLRWSLEHPVLEKSGEFKKANFRSVIKREPEIFLSAAEQNSYLWLILFKSKISGFYWLPACRQADGDNMNR
jgi:hypothetical protein